MASKKNDLEIIYNLQWKNKPANGDKNSSSIIGVYDIPATTLNWEVFKSYLLKNSGTPGDDVKVSYVTDNNKEYPIQSQTDFQVALYAFRRKARNGDVINLKLERVSDQPVHKNVRHSNDVETQFDNNEAASIISTCCNNSDTPPEWFLMCMSQFKKEITEELTATVSSIVSSAVSNIKPQTVPPPPCYHSRKSKEPSKRHRKVQSQHCEDKAEKDNLIKSLKLEHKLEKLESKTKKYKEKKLALFAKSTSDSEATGHSTNKSKPRNDHDYDASKMDASPVNTQASVPHMLGGEVYLHMWEVMNTGLSPWTSCTFLQYTWGSKALEPLDRIITVPYLKPGETGTLAVRLKVPNEPGQYECYWNFMHKGHRFGHWLGCQLVVDPFDLKGNKSVLDTDFSCFIGSAIKKFKDCNGEPQMMADNAVIHYGTVYHDGMGESTIEEANQVKCEETKDEQDCAKNVLEEIVRDVSAKVEQLKINEATDTDCSSDCENQSIVSITDSNSSKGSQDDEFVVVPIPDCFKVNKTDENLHKREEYVTIDAPQPSTSAGNGQNEENFDDNNNTEDAKSAIGKEDAVSFNGSEKDLVFISVSSEADRNDDEYTYVMVDGKKIPIPNKILKSEVLEHIQRSKDKFLKYNTSAAPPESATAPPRADDPLDFAVEVSATSSPLAAEPSNDLDLASHCSAAGSCYSDANNIIEGNSRLFIFPQNCPGYEVVNSELPELHEQLHRLGGTNESSAPPLNLSTHDRNPFSVDFGSQQHVPNYQQTPPSFRSAPPMAEVYAAPVASEVFVGDVYGNRRQSTSTPETVVEHQDIGQQQQPPVHILPETLVSGAVNVASSAINTARSVINMIVPPREQPGRWVNGHWVSIGQETPREVNLQALAEMGFWNRDLNATLLARYNDDLNRVVAELVQ